MKILLAFTIGGFLLASKAAAEETGAGDLTGDQSTAPVVLKAGSARKVKVRIKTDECSPANAHGAGLHASVTFEPQLGLQIRSRAITCSAPEGKQSDLTTRATAIETIIEIRAPKWLARTDYTVPAILHYEALDEKGTLIDKSMAFTIPVQVYPREAAHHEFNTDLALAAVLIILLWPVLLFECVFLGNCWVC